MMVVSGSFGRLKPKSYLSSRPTMLIIWVRGWQPLWFVEHSVDGNMSAETECPKPNFWSQESALTMYPLSKLGILAWLRQWEKLIFAKSKWTSNLLNHTPSPWLPFCTICYSWNSLSLVGYKFQEGQNYACLCPHGLAWFLVQMQ